jgi:hypothetical protein
VTFAHPWFLLGLLAALIPVLVHLFDRRRPRQVPFGALAFVLRSQKRTASRLKLKRLLLYALRTLIFLALPLALARPQCTRAEGALATRGAAATVVVLDTSLALRFHDGSGTLFDEARRQARAALSELLPEEPATVLLCGPRAPAPGPLSFEKARLISSLEEAKPGFELADVNRCLETAARLLDDSPLPARRIVLVSALTQGSLHLEASPPVTTWHGGEKLKPEVVLRDVAQGHALPNRAIVEARAEPAPQAGPRAWQFTFTVHNFSTEAAKDVELQLKVNGTAVAKGFLDLPAGGTAQKALTHRFAQGGTLTVEGALTPDALPDDDVRTLVVSVPEARRALLVNGSPSTQKYKDEAFFSEAALSAGGSPVQPTVRDADTAWREDLSQYDDVFLLNVEAPPPEAAARLTRFVDEGGGLFISMGDRVEPEAWNLALGALLPRKLRVVKTAVETQSPEAATGAARLTHIGLTHPVLTPFAGRAREGLLSTRFYRYMLFESQGEAGGAEVLGSLDDGAPVFIASRHGKGRVFAFASTVDRDWCDLPVRTGFLPLLQRVAAWLSGSLEEREELGAKVGEVVTLPLDPRHLAAAVRSPSGLEVPLARNAAGDAASVGPLPEPGVYAVSDEKGQPLPEAAFAASLDAAASDLSRHSPEELVAWFGDDSVRSAGPSGPARETPVWTWLLLTAVLAFFFEGVLLRR